MNHHVENKPSAIHGLKKYDDIIDVNTRRNMCIF